MTLDQLMAFTVNPDHERQEQVWEAIQRSYNKETAQIRRLLTEGAARASDKRARYVSIEYDAAGGPIMRDLDMSRQSIMGHSMGGHGALSIALTFPERFRSVSAFAPIVAPSQVPWGQKAFHGYLGDDVALWRKHDAVALIEDGARVKEILVDQGEVDPFLDQQLRPHLLASTCRKAGISVNLNLRSGYDHSYYFISTFMRDQLQWHADRLV